MKTYMKPTIEVITLRPDECIANANSGQNNGFGNGDQYPPGNSGDNNGAENDKGDKGNGKNH